MHEWYYIAEGEQQDPVSESELINLLKTKQLSPDTLVWMQNMKEWTPADKVETLIPEINQILNPEPAVELVEDPDIASAYSDQEIFLYIPISRLIFISVISCGLYEVYWIYKNWSYLKQRDNLDIMPFWRGWFGIFFCHSLFNKIHQDRELNRFEKASFQASPLATLWVIMIITANILSNLGNTVITIITLLLPAFLCFVPVQKFINKVNSKRNPNTPYTKWTTGHIVCVILGLLIWSSLLLTVTEHL